MVKEVLRFLITKLDGTYLDLNVGLGGHAEAICGVLRGDFQLIGIDLDTRALRLAAGRLERFGEHVTLLEGDHAEFPRLLETNGISRVDGVVFDLGMSSAQLDDAARGLSYDRPAPMDMRFSESGKTAAEILAEIDEHALAKAFREYGDLRSASRLSRAIVKHRTREPIATTDDLRRIVERTLRPSYANRRKILSKAFQAMRCLTTNEVASFEAALGACHDRLETEGVLCVLAYESVTDRLAKHEFNPPEVERDVYGNPLTPARWKRLTLRALKPSMSEGARNPRARSARLRAACKQEVQVS